MVLDWSQFKLEGLAVLEDLDTLEGMATLVDVVALEDFATLEDLAALEDVVALDGGLSCSEERLVAGYLAIGSACFLLRELILLLISRTKSSLLSHKKIK